MWWRGYKALPPVFIAFEGFWETVPAISATLTPPTWVNGPQIGLSHNSSPRHSFIATKYSPISPQFNEAQYPMLHSHYSNFFSTV